MLLDDGKGGTEVYRTEGIELRAGDRIRWTRNDAGLGLVNSRTAEMLAVANGRVTFQLEDGKKLELGKGDPQLRHLDHAWASTVHAFQGRTVDNVIAAMEARHPHLTTQKSFYDEISRARDQAELVTDDAAELRAQLQAVTGERIAALEGIGEMPREAAERAVELAPTSETRPGGGAGTSAEKEREGVASPAKEREMPVLERGKETGMDLGLYCCQVMGGNSLKWVDSRIYLGANLSMVVVPVREAFTDVEADSISMQCVPVAYVS